MGVPLGTEVMAGLGVVDEGSPSVVNIESDTAPVDAGALLVTMVVTSVLVLVVGAAAGVDTGLDEGVKLNEQFLENTIAASPLGSVMGVFTTVQISVVLPPNL